MIEQRHWLYKLIEIIGIYIPALGIVGYFGYVKTDTLKETIIVLSVMYICIAILGLFYKFFKTHKYNFQNKVEIVALEYVENLGYDITQIDKVTVDDSSNRFEPIWILMQNGKLDSKSERPNLLEMVYSDGEIIEFR